MRAEMPLNEAMNLADRYRRTIDGQYAEAFGVLCDYIVSTQQRLKEATERVREAEEKVQALSLDLGVKENRVRPTLVRGGKDPGPGDSTSVGVSIGGVQGKGGVF